MSIIHNLSEGITLNEKQQEFCNLVTSQQSCCLIGAAGTGKTTAVRNAINSLVASGVIPKMDCSTGRKGNEKLYKDNYGICGLAFTRRASSNLSANFPDYLYSHCMTIHALLEYEPVEKTGLDENGMIKNTMVFEPQRNSSNPLPSSLKVIVIDEASMVGTDLFTNLMKAIKHDVQFIFIGDLNQLAPVFGDAVLGYKLLSLPVIELTEVYRQALESPIISLAHRILQGKQILPPEIESTWKDIDRGEHGNLTIKRFVAGTDEHAAENISVGFLKQKFLAGEFDPTSDLVLIPFNINFGTISVSQGIANFLDEHVGTYPQEIIAGWKKCYFKVGDEVLYKNNEYRISKIVRNGLYQGEPARDGSFNRMGRVLTLDAISEASIDASLAKLNFAYNQDNNKDDEIANAASHIISLNRVDKDGNLSDKVVHELSSRGQINCLALNYCTTAHKAQGLEANRVFILLHKLHAKMVSREWLYTAVTRAKHSLTILCESTTFVSGINNQQIKGNGLAEKAEFFKGRVKEKQTGQQKFLLASH